MHSDVNLTNLGGDHRLLINYHCRWRHERQFIDSSKEHTKFSISYGRTRSVVEVFCMAHLEKFGVFCSSTQEKNYVLITQDMEWLEIQKLSTYTNAVRGNFCLLLLSVYYSFKSGRLPLINENYFLYDF